MKWFFAILAILVGGAIGWYISQKKKKREIMLNKLYNMCDIISNNLQFSREPIDKILESATQDNMDMKRLYIAYRDARDDENRQRKATLDAARGCSLNTAEAETASDFFGSLGKSDAQSQIGAIAHYKNLFDGYRTEAHSEWKKTGALFWKLGLLIGAGVAILIL